MQDRKCEDCKDVAVIFSDFVIAGLAKIAKLRDSANLQEFGIDVREAVSQYLVDRKTASSNSVGREIKKLHALGRAKKYGELASAIESLTSSTKTLILDRQARVQARMPHWRIPSTEELRRSETQAAAAENLLALLDTGEQWKVGRTRPSGKRSLTWEPVLCAPTPGKGEPRREAERKLVMWLQIAVQKQLPNDETVAITADRREPGPFARFVGNCLSQIMTINSLQAEQLAVQIINDARNQRHREALDDGTIVWRLKD